MCLGSMQCRKECDSERVGCAKGQPPERRPRAAGAPVMPAPLARESAEGKGDMREKE